MDATYDCWWNCDCCCIWFRDWKWCAVAAHSIKRRVEIFGVSLAAMTELIRASDLYRQTAKHECLKDERANHQSSVCMEMSCDTRMARTRVATICRYSHRCSHLMK